MPCINIGNFNADALEDTIVLASEVHRKKIRHLYRRLGYGATLSNLTSSTFPSDVDTYSELVEYLIDTAANIEFPEEFDWEERSFATKTSDDATSFKHHTSLIHNHWINECITEGIKSKLTLFWRNHFVASETDFTSKTSEIRYYKILFENAFGNFKEFVKKIGRTPLMLNYLNGDRAIGNPSGKYADANPPVSEPNENYARELLELFTMGINDKNGNPNYNADTINELARVFSGWRQSAFEWALHNNGLALTEKDAAYPLSCRPRLEEYALQYRQHDWGNKDIFGTTIDVKDLVDKVFVDVGVYNGQSVFEYIIGQSNNVSGSNTLATGTPIEPNGNDYGIDDGNIDSTAENGLYYYKQLDPYTGLFSSYDTITTTNLGLGLLTAANKEYNAVHDAIFTEKADDIAYFICKKLYQFYIYADTDNPSVDQIDLKDYLEKLALTFSANWDIKAVLKQMFKSQHFYDAGVMGTQIKSHIESAVSFFRAANLQPGWEEGTNYDYKYRFTLLPPDTMTPDTPANWDNGMPTHPHYAFGFVNDFTGEGATGQENVLGENFLFDKSHTMFIKGECKKVGQDLESPPNVAGWQGHHNWLNEFTLIKRRGLLECCLTDACTTNSYGFSDATKAKFRQLAIDLFNTEPLTSAETFEGTYPFPYSEKVVRVLWRHFFSVKPEGNQVTGAIDVYLYNSSLETYGEPNLIGGNPEDIAQRITNILLYFIRQPEYQLV